MLFGCSVVAMMRACHRFYNKENLLKGVLVFSCVNKFSMFFMKTNFTLNVKGLCARERESKSLYFGHEMFCIENLIFHWVCVWGKYLKINFKTNYWNIWPFTFQQLDGIKSYNKQGFGNIMPNGQIPVNNFLSKISSHSAAHREAGLPAPALKQWESESSNEAIKEEQTFTM